MNYESQQPPLYYWLFAISMRWESASPLLSRVYLMRLLGILLASAVIPLTYGIARRVLRSEPQALGVTAIVVLLPELMINAARVGNESLALVCYTAMLAAAVMAVHKPLSWRAWLLLGAALGCGLLSKAYVLSALPAVITVGVLALWFPAQAGKRRANPVSIVACLAAAFAVSLAIAGRWYAHVHRATGSWTGVKDDIAAGHLPQKLGQISHVKWKSGVLSILISHVWFGAWSFLRVPNVIYVATFVVIAVAVAGLVVRLWRGRGAIGEMSAILVLAAFYLCFWAGLLYDVLVIYLSKGVSASTGWYLYAAVAAEIVLLVWGLQAFVPTRIMFPALAICVAALDLYGMCTLLMPYYSGLTSHVGGTVHPTFGATLTQLPMVFDRLAQLRPPWLSATSLVCLWIGYWIATAAPVLAQC